MLHKSLYPSLLFMLAACSQLDKKPVDIAQHKDETVSMAKSPDKSPSAETLPDNMLNVFWVPENNVMPYAYLSFEADNAVIGFGGCNQMFGGYDLSAKGLTIGPLASTRLACTHLKTEHAFGQALEATQSYELSANTLILKNSDGQIVLTLEKRDSKPG